MEQFRQLGETLGSIRAMMVFQDSMFNPRQCCLLAEMISSGYNTVSKHMRTHLQFEEKNTKWKIMDHPLKELHRVFKEAEAYIKQCSEPREWLGKAILLHRDCYCVEFLVHNLLTSIPIAIEAIEMAGQISGCDQEQMQKKRALHSFKYHRDLKDPRMFKWLFGEEYLVSSYFCDPLDSVFDEERQFLLKKIKDMKRRGRLKSKKEHGLADILIKHLNPDNEDQLLLPSSIFVSCKDYQVRKRLGSGSQFKEILWLGESFALRHFFGDIEQLEGEIQREFTLSHPNILQILCGFTDEEKRECFLVMELMSRDLSSYIKEISCRRKQLPFSLPVAVDLMLQIARGMEYLHSKEIWHGELNPSNILIKGRQSCGDGFLHAKISGFGLSSSITRLNRKTEIDNQHPQPFRIWFAPEVLAEQEQELLAGEVNSKYSEKSDVYSFGMICFQLLTGKVPFEDAHLQGDKMSRNIRAGERPLFPYHSPKYLTSLTKKCWHSDPIQRPCFSSICRILRHTKRFLAMNPEQGQPDALLPPTDFSDLEASFIRNLPCLSNQELVLPVHEIPFQMFSYRVAEKEKANVILRDHSESGSDGGTSTDDNVTPGEDLLASPSGRRSLPSLRSLPSPDIMARKLSLPRMPLGIKTSAQPGKPKGSFVRPPHTPRRMNSESRLYSPRTRRGSGHSSDSELH